MAKRSGRMRHSALGAEVDDFIALMRSVPGVDGLRTAFAETIDSYSFRTFVYGGMHLPQLVNGGENMYRRGGVKLHQGLRR